MTNHKNRIRALEQRAAIDPAQPVKPLQDPYERALELAKQLEGQPAEPITAEDIAWLELGAREWASPANNPYKAILKRSKADTNGKTHIR